MAVTKDTLIMEALEMGDADKIAEVLYSFGMHCLGCALSRGETIGEAAMAHGVEADDIVAKINEIIEKK